jgi:hypothetical protein
MPTVGHFFPFLSKARDTAIMPAFKNQKKEMFREF